jgi:hypothetical protein
MAMNPSLATRPVIWISSMMGKRNHSKLVPAGVVDNAERKLPQRETASPVFPECAKLRMTTEKGECALELSDECKA